ncbi:hypothetical protein OAN34_03845 [Hyphomicrobiales bacterium]|nr:hypothetical protein [Hyphomicrobiales bacterium]
MKNLNMLLLISLCIAFINPLFANERICFDTKDIENIRFKKDFLLFQNRKNISYTVTCKGNRHLSFQSPLIIDPQKMGYKICSNDVLKLKEYSCFIDEITLVVEENKE